MASQEVIVLIVGEVSQRLLIQGEFLRILFHGKAPFLTKQHLPILFCVFEPGRSLRKM